MHTTITNIKEEKIQTHHIHHHHLLNYGHMKTKKLQPILLPHGNNALSFSVKLRALVINTEPQPGWLIAHICHSTLFQENTFFFFRSCVAFELEAAIFHCSFFRKENKTTLWKSIQEVFRVVWLSDHMTQSILGEKKTDSL